MIYSDNKEYYYVHGKTFGTRVYNVASKEQAIESIAQPLRSCEGWDESEVATWTVSGPHLRGDDE